MTPVRRRIRRAMQVHGALDTTSKVPFFHMIHSAGVMGLADGSTEVHKVTVARQVLRDYRPSDNRWPTERIPKKVEAAKATFADYLEHEMGNL
nr:hypothetical protein [Frankia sp. Cas3]